jgi:hypothetical protein
MALKPQLDEVRMVSVRGILGHGFPDCCFSASTSDLTS